MSNNSLYEPLIPTTMQNEEQENKKGRLSTAYPFGKPAQTTLQR